MFKNYFKIAWRNLLRHKGYSLLNISGLSVGIACCLLIVMYVIDELSYDKFHVNGDRLYRVSMSTTVTGKTDRNAAVHFPVAPLLRGYPEVEETARLVDYRFIGQIPVLQFGDKSFYEENFFYGDSTIFKVLTLPLLQGNPNALYEPNTVVMTREMAKKYFGDNNPLGQVLRLNGLKDLKVTGILAPFPGPTHLKIDFIASMSSIANSGFTGPGFDFNNWIINFYWTYVLFKTPSDAALLESQLPDFGKRYLPDLHQKNGTQLHLTKVSDIHLSPGNDGEITPCGDITYVYIFSLVAILILFIACINFMNLVTARSAGRAKEIGLRKVAGALRKQLIGQFLGESILLTVLSAFIALFLIEGLTPMFNQLTGKTLAMNFEPWLVLSLLAVIVVVGLAAGSYPAFYFSNFQPAQVLKGTFKTGGKGVLLRKILVILQFSISIALITCTIIAQHQLYFIQNKKLGFEKEQLVILPIRGSILGQKYAEFKNQLLQHPGIVSVSGLSDKIGTGVNFTGFFVEGQDEMQFISQTRISHDFIKTYGLRLVEGRDLIEGSATDSASGYIVNRAFLRQYGWETGVGKRVRFFRSTVEGQIVGVVEDFHFQSLHTPVAPIVMRIGNTSFLAVKIRPENMRETISVIESAWNRFEHDKPFTFHFLDQAINDLYKSEQKLSMLIGTFSGLAILIACLGLFGLASFTAEQRTKEIGIRKVLGASVGGIVFIMCKEFLKFVLIANIIAWPVAYLAMNMWLQDFASRIDIGPSAFILAAVFALTIALVTVGYQAIKAALSNPLKSIKYE
ncbi:ABC transporter permease [bacterium]|nr:ABC transporter permease [bacterium]